MTDRIVYERNELRVGQFRRYPWQRPFADTGPIEGFLIVFPRTSVVIQHAGEAPVVADPTRAMLYNRGQEYRRRALSERGDESEFFAFAPELIAEALADGDPSAEGRLDRPWTKTHVPADAPTFLLQRAIVEHLEHAGRPDPLFVEEAMLRLLARCARATLDDKARSRARRARTVDDHRALAERCRILLAERLGEPLSLAELARAAGASPFHLARVFQRHAGTSLHAYRDELRLRTSLERVSRGCDLTRVALDLGYASHSHFTVAFRRRFGATPSAWRRETSKILTARPHPRGRSWRA